MRNSNADLVNNNKAHSYMAFYSTTFEPKENGMDVYRTCVMVTGVTFTVAEQIVAYEEVEDEHQVGTKLECKGWFLPSCYNVPYYAKRRTTRPILKRSTLSLKEQKDLHNWMVNQAIESAGHLVGAGSLDHSESHLFLSDEDSAWKWDPRRYQQEL